MGSFTLQNLCFSTRNTWIRDGLAEVLCTFILAVFVYASGAQDVLSNGEAGSASARAFTGAAGLMIAVYSTIGTSGGSGNPNVTLMLCMLGRIKWRKLPLYVLCEMIGAFLGATLTYYIYHDHFHAYDGGVRIAFGENATAHLFTSFPHKNISWTTGFFDVVTATALLTFSIAAISDIKNAGTPKYIVPLALVPMLFAILNAFGLNTGAAINTALDLSGRLFATIVYGGQVMSDVTGECWAWIPPTAGFLGAITGAILYQVMSGNHLGQEVSSSTSDYIKHTDSLGNGCSRNPSRSTTSVDSIRTLTTSVDSWS